MKYFKPELKDFIEEQIRVICEREEFDFEIGEINFEQLSNPESPRFSVQMNWLFSPDLKWESEEGMCAFISDQLESLDFGGSKISITAKFNGGELSNIFGMPIERFIEKSREEFLKSEKERLANQSSPNLYNNKDAATKFSELADNQRGAPEIAMVECQSLLGGGVLSHQLEHIGDLTHRVSQGIYSKNLQLERSIFDILPKIERGISSLRHGYGFLREHGENMENSFKYLHEGKGRFKTFEEFEHQVASQLEKYVQEHEKLEVYNEFQYYCRQAAIDLGKLNVDEAACSLEKLKEFIDSDLFLEKACGFEPGYQPELKNKSKLRF